MKPIAIIKTGSVAKAIADQHGDFEDWILSGLGLNAEDVEIFDIQKGTPLPEPEAFSGLIITGSSALVTNREKWSEACALWLRKTIPKGQPILGICYGHQLIAHALGGQVDHNPKGREIGTIEVQFNEKARSDALFGGLSNNLVVHATHVQSVLTPPDSSVVLGRNNLDAFQAFFLPPACWAVQFHPEFNDSIMRAFLTSRADQLQAEGLDPEKLLSHVQSSNDGTAILKRFAQIVIERANELSIDEGH